MCENIVEKSATVKKELIPTTAIKLATATVLPTKPIQIACGGNTTSSYSIISNAINPNGFINMGRDTESHCGDGSSSSAAMSLFDQLKNSVSHNLTVTDRTTNNKNGHKVKTLLSHHNENQETQHSNNNNSSNSSSNKTQIYHTRSLLKPLAKNEQKPQQQQQQELHDNSNANDTDRMLADEGAEFADGEETREENNEKLPDILHEESQSYDYQQQIKIKQLLNINEKQNYYDAQKEEYYEEEKEHEQYNHQNIVEDDEEYNDSSASSISATTAPLQIALDSTSSHSSNSNNSFAEYCEKMNAQTTSLMSDNSRKLSTNSDLKEKKFEQATATIACQTQPLSFLSNSSNEIPTNVSSDDSKTTIISTSLNSSSNLIVGNIFTTDVGKTVMDGGKYIKKTAGEQQKQQSASGTAAKISSTTTSSLLLPQTVSPLLGIVHGTKRDTMTPAAPPTMQIQQMQPQQKKQNTRSVVSTNSLAHSAVSSSSLIDIIKTTTMSTTMPSISSGVAGGASRNRKSNKNLNNDISIYTTQQLPQQNIFQQIPIEQQQIQQLNHIHQVSNNTTTHSQRDQHKTTSTNAAKNNNKRIQKSVLDFDGLSLNEQRKCKLENSSSNRIDNKRKRCNDRYDSSESSDR